MSTLSERIKAKALALGFDAVGITTATPGEHLAFYLQWVDAGYHAGQSYLSRPDRILRRRDPNVILKDALSLVVVGLHYWPGSPPPEVKDPSRGRISCYAQGKDYHDLMLPMLTDMLTFIQKEAPQPVSGRAYVDTGPLLERDHAWSAGLGFIGKNCNLIRPRHGSWLFLGELLLDLALPPDEPNRLISCGNCTRCQEACPTGALVRPFTLDSRRCISYYTTAHKGAIPREIRPLLSNQIFGCDICQSVCPWNRFSPVRDNHLNVGAPPLKALIELSNREFRLRFGQTPIGSIGYERFLRNVSVALGNWGDEATPALEKALAIPSALVRGHVAWALGQIDTQRARVALETALGREQDSFAKEEIRLALG